MPRLASHPSAPLLLQSAKPPLQANPQADALHVVDAFAREAHPLPHAEQCEGLLVVLVSQPFAGFPSQLPKPVVQLCTWQLPPPHVATPLATEHALPHIPQWVVLLSAVSQPLAMLPSQLPKPVVQPASAHVPALHEALPLANEHALPHIPQCVVLLSDVSQPLAMLPSQLPKSALHDPMRQAPAAHAAVPLAIAHALPHIPQWATSVAVSTHAPPQRACPEGHPLPHALPPQTGVAPLQRRPHIPQWVSLLSGVSQPLAAIMSQSPKPAWQTYWHCPAALHEGTMFGRGPHDPHEPPH